MADAAESMRRGQGAAVASRWLQMLKLDPDHAAALNYLGAHALAQGDHRSAHEYLQTPVLRLQANLSRLHIRERMLTRWNAR